MTSIYEKFDTVFEGDGFALLKGNLYDLLPAKKIAKIKEKTKELNYIIQPEVVIFGKPCKQRRDVVFLSNEVEKYKYAGYDAMATKIPKEYDSIIKLFNIERFNGILVNRYNTGQEYIGIHSDDEKDLTKIGVVSITFNELDGERRFQIRPKKDIEVNFRGEEGQETYIKMCEQGKICCEVVTTDGMILIMKGKKFQGLFTHGIPVQTNPIRLGRKKNNEKAEVGTRWSLTLRKHE